MFRPSISFRSSTSSSNIIPCFPLLQKKQHQHPVTVDRSYQLTHLPTYLPRYSQMTLSSETQSRKMSRAQLLVTSFQVLLVISLFPTIGLATSSSSTTLITTSPLPATTTSTETEPPQKTAASSPQLTYAEVAGIASAAGGVAFLLLVGFGWWSCYGKARRAERKKKKREAEEAALGIGLGGLGAGARDGPNDRGIGWTRESSSEVDIPERMRK